jgi:hypothetical protein
MPVLDPVMSTTFPFRSRIAGTSRRSRFDSLAGFRN